MWVLVYGEAKVDISGQLVATLKGNTAFGEAALKHKTKRNASIVALTQCKILILDKEDYDRVISDSVQKQRQQNLEFMYAKSLIKYSDKLDFLSSWSRFKRYELNDVIDLKILNHNEMVYKQGDKAPLFNGPCKFLLCYNLIVNIIKSGYVKLCTNVKIETINR